MTVVPLNQLGLSRSAREARSVDDELAAELDRFEAEERARLGLGARRQYVEKTFQDPTKADKRTTTLLVSGLTLAHDFLVSAALGGIGYTVVPLDCPDEEALRFGKEYGNRGQCNPTWFTVGNLVKHLVHLRDREGIPTERIIEDYVFLTAGSCGPCRFGMYVTEYRKALRDAGFEGFRVLLFQMAGGIKQASGDEKKGLVFDPKFFWQIAQALIVGDVINALGYRIRPFEVEAGATDKALDEVKTLVADTLRARGSILGAILGARRILSRVAVDRLRPKPKVGIIGEFWAMTTEGDGNYKMQRFLEKEGAEVDIQVIAAWILFMVWEGARDTRHRMTLAQDDQSRKGLAGKDPKKKLRMLWLGDKAMRLLFQTAANMMGLHGFVLPDMDEIARIAKEHYNLDVRGGEAHMEVAKNILNVLHAKVNMTLSVKPFGCMPSSGVSDGVQSAITELYPEAIFLPIETTGDGAVNVQSRVQMMLFKAKQAAKKERDEVLAAYGMDEDRARAVLAKVPFVGRALFKAPHVHASTAADQAELAGFLTKPWIGVKRWWDRRKDHQEERVARHLASRG
ncbi:MAG: 2-hydroxyglutaryl-CoA dehydratase [Deltaproteobacteria bacterium]|nr:2-hydroxyglutaryl-CoA dehydratase [Deltaproteobacteria bacterium]